jgi:hypothetical protein
MFYLEINNMKDELYSLTHLRNSNYVMPFKTCEAIFKSIIKAGLIKRKEHGTQHFYDSVYVKLLIQISWHIPRVKINANRVTHYMYDDVNEITLFSRIGCGEGVMHRNSGSRNCTEEEALQEIHQMMMFDDQIEPWLNALLIGLI